MTYPTSSEKEGKEYTPYFLGKVVTLCSPGYTTVGSRLPLPVQSKTETDRSGHRDSYERRPVDPSPVRETGVRFRSTNRRTPGPGYPRGGSRSRVPGGRRRSTEGSSLGRRFHEEWGTEGLRAEVRSYFPKNISFQ